jgi:hypothetical protein
MKALWIMNKYISGENNEIFYPFFLKYIQKELEKRDHQLSFVFFSDLFIASALTKNNFIYNKDKFDNLTSTELKTEAKRIEREYNFTFKQAYFPDLIQTSNNQYFRKITVPEDKFNNLDHLVSRFLFLEELILSQNFDVIFSDVSPEAEMEFGRAIGYKHNKLVLKAYEGSALGRTVFLQHFEFDKERLIEAPYNLDFTYNDAKTFCEDFIRNKRLPYLFPDEYFGNYSIKIRLFNKLKHKSFFAFSSWMFFYPFRFLKKQLFDFYLWIEQYFIKPIIQDKFDSKLPYIFMGFHLNSESTMCLRSLPYVNQIALIEMISRVLPYGHYLYVRGHPHWPKTFPASYLYKINKKPNVRLISDKFSIHEIIQNAQGILTYNATTGIESLIYGKPVLSFAPNIYYKQHPAVDFCSDLYELGAKLSILINTQVAKEDTYKYIQKLMCISNDMVIGSYNILSETDAKDKAERFTTHLIAAIDWCKNNN